LLASTAAVARRCRVSISTTGRPSEAVIRAACGWLPADIWLTPPLAQARKSIHPAPVPSSPVSACRASAHAAAASGTSPVRSADRAVTTASVRAALEDTPAPTGRSVLAVTTTPARSAAAGRVILAAACMWSSTSPS
jgi:hypothetical protein